MLLLMFLFSSDLRRLYDWLDRTEVALWVTGIATAVLALGVILALFGLRDSRKTRDGEIVVELSARWNEEKTVESRMAYSDHGPTGIVALLERLYGQAEDQPPASRDDLELFYKLIRWPTLIETTGVLNDHGAISTKIVYKMWGAGIVTAWEAWEEPVKRLRELEGFPDTFRQFQRLAKAMQKKTRKEIGSNGRGVASATRAAAAAADRKSGKNS